MKSKMSISFVEALSTDNLAGIKAAAKTDVHCHAFFSARLDHVERWTGSSLPKPPLKMKGVEGMMEYADAVLAPRIKRREGLEFVAAAGIRDAIQDGVVLLEMSFDIRQAEFYPNGLEGLCGWIETLTEECKTRIDLRPELGFSRGCAGNADLMRLAHDAVELGFFQSIDLYSRPEVCPPETMKPLFSKARAAGMKLKAHVGEFGGAEEVLRTVEILELDEVQHGVGAAESVEAMRRLASRQIQLNVCPTSNVTLGGAPDLASHPIRALFDNGVHVTVNTDDLMIFNQSVSDEYRNLYRAGVFSAQELDSIRQSSLQSIKGDTEWTT